MTLLLITYAVITALVLKLLTVICQRTWHVQIGDVEGGFVLGGVIGMLVTVGFERGHLFSMVAIALIILGYLSIRISIRKFTRQRSEHSGDQRK